MARERRLEKTVNYETGAVSVKVISTGQELICDINTLPEDIKKKLIPLAVSHRIGDAAAGLDGAEAFESMSKVWAGLQAGNFTIRAAAGTKEKSGVKLSDLKEKLGALSGREAAAAAALLEKLGLGALLGALPPAE